MNTVMVQVDDDLYIRAQRVAEARRTTVSAMVERLLRAVAAPPLKRDDLPPLTRQALGMLPPMSDERVSQVLDEERMRKFETP